MASIVSAGTTSATALNMSADTTGILQLASNNGTVAVTVDTSQRVGVGIASPTQVLSLYSAPAGGSGVGTAIIITSDGSGGDNGYIGVNKGVGNGLTLGCQNRDIIFQTGNTSPFNGTERMRISSAGYVTTPSQPVFYAFRNSSATYSNNTALIFDATGVNTGSNYSTSTGRFTAPVAGNYNFSFVVLTQGLSNGDVCEWGMSVNGSAVVLGGRMSYQANYTGSAGYLWSCGSGTFSLNASDYVEVRNQSGANRTVNTTAWVNFSGFLIG
jgi:hypothetical protein